ncbi:MAG: hypothetical protein NVSMB1_17940 [Polyangiales bacterium]
MGCGGPRYANSSPPELAAARAAVPLRRVLLITPGMANFDFRDGFYLFRLKFEEENQLPDAVAVLPKWMVVQPIGAVRTGDAILSAEDYFALRCGWGYLPSGRHSRVTACKSRDIASDRNRMRAIVLDRISELMRQGGGLGATVIDDTRCFASEDHSRLWCEGIAAFSDSIPPRVAGST